MGHGRETTLAIALVALLAAQGTALGASCKTLKGEFVGFGQESAKSYADGVLDRQIGDWETRHNRKAVPKNRKMVCKDYIKALNEFECTAEATVCVEQTGHRRQPQLR